MERGATEGAGGGWQIGEDHGPGQILVLDRDVGRTEAHVEALARLGLATATASSTRDALDRLEADRAIDTILVEARTSTQGSRPFAAELRDRFEGRRRFRTVVVADDETLDLAFDNLDESPVELLCLPISPDDYRDALGLPSRNRGGVRETSSIVTPRLAQLSDEVGRIARALANLAADAPEARAPEPQLVPEPEPRVTPHYVRSIIKARRQRDQFFSPELFADPAWDILLDLMSARLEHKRVSGSSLCIAAAVPATTALRWIKSMTDAGLLVRRADPLDGRRVFIDLSDEAASSMNSYLAGFARGTVI